MHPYLFDLTLFGEHFRPPTYGVLMAAAFTLAYLEALRLSTKTKNGPRHIENLFLIVVLSSVVGARMFHVIFEDPNFYFKNPEHIFYIWNGGYTLYGALILAVLSGYIYTYFRQISFFEFADICGPPIALGIGVGRLGCFFAGCCWGHITDLPWGVTFSHPEAFSAVRDVPVHPTQLYESFACLALYGYLVWRTKTQEYRGQVFFHLFLGYSAIRYWVELFRGDEYRGFVFGGLLSYSQFISLIIIPFTVVAMFLFSRTQFPKRRKQN